MFGQTATTLGSYRFNPPPGEGPIPDPMHPDYTSIKTFLKSFTDVKELFLWLNARYGPYTSTATFDIAAANLMSVDTQRGIYASLFNMYNCSNTQWQADPTPQPGGGGGGTTARTAQWCYYMVTYSGGAEVSRNFLGCW